MRLVASAICLMLFAVGGFLIATAFGWVAHQTVVAIKPAAVWIW